MVYVDDVLALGEDIALDAFYHWLGQKWECDEWTKLTATNHIRFLGMELCQTEEGFELGQKGFTQELLCSHGQGSARGPKGHVTYW